MPITINDVGWSFAFIGPSGSGKSSMILQAAKALGSGVIVCLPGVEEWNSYEELFPQAETDLASDAPYVLLKADNWDEARGIKRQLTSYARATKEGKAKKRAMAALDRFDGMSSLCSDWRLDSLGLTEMPKAKSPEGAAFFGGISQEMNSFMRSMTSLRGYGMLFLGTAHTKESKGSAATSADEGAKLDEQYMPVITGSYRDQVLGAFDLTFYTSMKRTASGAQFFLRWEGNSKQRAKVRAGLVLGDKPKIPADWLQLQRRIEAARRKRDGGPNGGSTEASTKKSAK